MHDVPGAEHLEGLDQLAEVVDGLGLRERLVVLENGFESAPAAKLVDEVVVVGGFEHVEVAHDVGALGQGRQDVHLVVGALKQLGCLLQALSAHHFYRHWLLCMHVDCPVDR